jgi:regulator of RNase E activity RraA
MFSSLVTSCENSTEQVQPSGAGQSSGYLKYKDILDKCFTAVIQDVMDTMNLRAQCMDPAVKPLSPSMKAWGEARTIYMEAVTEIPEKPYQLEMELLDDAKEGQIIVAQCDTRVLSSFWGGLLSNAAVGHKLHGVVMDGTSRDYGEIVELGFPTFCAGLSPYDSLGRTDGKEVDIPIECGGVRVSPGDLVYGDIDGVVVVPKEVAEIVINKAWEKVKGESKVRDELRSGASVEETFKKYGIL